MRVSMEAPQGGLFIMGGRWPLCRVLAMFDISRSDPQEELSGFQGSNAKTLAVLVCALGGLVSRRNSYLPL